MITLAIALGIIGFALTVVGGVITYTGRMREKTPGSGLYTIPTAGRGTLALTVSGAVVALVGLFVGLAV
ncbi:hypothetical protein BWO91_17245 [Plantibacter flavus]|uniref:hypothetical protein n=1 Tax=Plantibacter flavus TaxID=150123 RepID=UPI00099B650D|nr:hypothetical protein [Plantibacter flavus]AQX81472.1 hypothetical protein BWO91_17245 [Plantibacter flavus]